MRLSACGIQWHHNLAATEWTIAANKDKIDGYYYQDYLNQPKFLRDGLTKVSGNVSRMLVHGFSRD